MRTRAVIVALVMAVTGLGGLVVYQAYLLRKPPLPSRSVPDVSAKASGPDLVPTIVRPKLLAQLEAGPVETNDLRRVFHWRNVETADYRSYIENLRAIGCPEQTVRDIVIADVQRLYANRRAALLTQGKAPKFWETRDPAASGNDASQAKELAALESEKTQTIRSLLNIDPATEQRKIQYGVTYPDNRLGNLPPDKQDQVSLIREEFNERWEKAQATLNQGAQSEDEMTTLLRQMDAERLAKLSRVLTPEELREHELQTSWTAITMRNELSDFRPTEEEFLKIYELRKAFDDEYVHYFHGRTDEAALAQKEKAQTELNERLRDALGEERYAEYRGGSSKAFPETAR